MMLEIAMMWTNFLAMLILMVGTICFAFWVLKPTLIQSLSIALREKTYNDLESELAKNQGKILGIDLDEAEYKKQLLKNKSDPVRKAIEERILRDIQNQNKIEDQIRQKI